MSIKHSQFIAVGMMLALLGLAGPARAAEKKSATDHARTAVKEADQAVGQALQEVGQTINTAGAKTQAQLQSVAKAAEQGTMATGEAVETWMHKFRRTLGGWLRTLGEKIEPPAK